MFCVTVAPRTLSGKLPGLPAPSQFGLDTVSMGRRLFGGVAEFAVASSTWRATMPFADEIVLPKLSVNRAVQANGTPAVALLGVSTVILERGPGTNVTVT